MPPLQETRQYLMKYFLDRQPDSRGKRYTPYYDIVFILDSSASISQGQFNLSLITARNLVTRFAPDTQFAAVTFGTNATVNFNFNSSRVRGLLLTFSISAFLTRINNEKTSLTTVLTTSFGKKMTKSVPINQNLFASVYLVPAYAQLKTSL